MTGIALIENKSTTLNNEDLDYLTYGSTDIENHSFISTTFEGFYFLSTENVWLDRINLKILALDHFYQGKLLAEKRALAMWALGQACLIKRPFNLFHRKNLHLRTSDVARHFGNKTTWEIPFSEAMTRFAKEANLVVFDNNKDNQAINQDAFSVKQSNYDLVYLDPPYFFKVSVEIQIIIGYITF